jgi:hypothetical protein
MPAAKATEEGRLTIEADYADIRIPLRQKRCVEALRAKYAAPYSEPSRSQLRAVPFYRSKQPARQRRRRASGKRKDTPQELHGGVAPKSSLASATSSVSNNETLQSTNAKSPGATSEAAAAYVSLSPSVSMSAASMCR